MPALLEFSWISCYYSSSIIYVNLPMLQWESATFKKYLFIGASSIIVSIFLILLLLYPRELDKPAVCNCARIFHSDSSISIRAARLIVGNGHYQYTIQTAKRDCISSYRQEITDWRKATKSLMDSTQAAMIYFQKHCPAY
jgi:hypothetical protein